MISEIIVSYLLAYTVVNARVYYIDDDSNVVKKNDHAISYDNVNNFEQSSRDLDLSFSTGDDTYYPRDNYPIFKRVNPVRPFETVEKQYFEINKEIDRPTYKLIELPDRRPRYEEIFVEPKNNNNKLTQSGTGADRKGEVILELRVITNNDAILLIDVINAGDNLSDIYNLLKKKK